MLTAILLVGSVTAQVINSVDITHDIINPNTKLEVYLNINYFEGQDIFVRYYISDEANITPTAVLLKKADSNRILLYNEYLLEYFEDGKYSISIDILNIDEDIIDSKQIDFEATGYGKKFELELKTCKDQSCLEKSKIFIQNTDIYLDYDSEVPEPTITATLTLPDQTTQQLTLPTSIKAEQIGTYELDITASKQDYKTITRKEQFGVIEKQADIPFVGVCSANGKCEGGENYQNCPQDCPIPEPKTNIIIIILLILIIVVLISFVTYYLYNLRKQQLLELQNYIINTERKGYTEVQIKAELIRDGWPEKQIDKAFNKLRR
jgi:hypothetical protein